MKKTFIAIAVLVLATNVYATRGNNGGGNGGCGVGQQTNGCGGDTTPPVVPGAENHGGSATANAGAIAGAVAGSSSIAKGGSASLDSTIKNSVNVTNVSTSLTNIKNVSDLSNHNAVTAVGGAGGSAMSEGSTSNSGGNVMTVTQEAQERNPVSTAYAPSIAPTATCMGSTSAGAQGASFGISFGSTWADENCMKLEQVRVVSTVLNDARTAAQMMCGIPAYAEAREAMGMPCHGVKTTAVDMPQQYTDPYVRARLGLSPIE